MHAGDRVFMSRLISKIIAQQNEIVGQLAAGNAKDIEDYRDRTGYIRALEHVRAWCQEIAESDEPNPPRT